jgi:indole-3-glycerol phosphate synthase
MGFNRATTQETGTILDRIVADRRERLEEDRARRPIAELQMLLATRTSPLDFVARLREGRPDSPANTRLRLIAEIKRASPSKGMLHSKLDAAVLTRTYAEAGAAAVSVLTEPNFFHGSIDDLSAAADVLIDDPNRPALLRKDFVFDPYQVIEARAYGADALLLIAMLLTPETLAELLTLTRSYGMEALVEVHNATEIETALAVGAEVIGINNRDLRTFNEDLSTFERLAPLLPDNSTIVAESAISTRNDAERMASAGAHALLVGESLVRSDEVFTKAHELMLIETTTQDGT